MTTVTGTITTTRKGLGFVENPQDPENDIFIDAGNLNTALNGDIVTVELLAKASSGQSRPRGGRDAKTAEITGKVIHIVHRARTTFVGTVDIENSLSFIVPDDKKMYTDFIVSPREIERFAYSDSGHGIIPVTGDKVHVELLNWTDPKKNPEVRILRILGKKGINDVEMESIVLEKGFETSFPPKVEDEAHALEKSEKPISASEIARRRDMRDVTTFTIDPFDAKDFDDAISFRPAPEEILVKNNIKASGTLYEIGVHIADVSHYVQPGSELDKEALKRGCSIYLVDRTIPMLPEVLSNDMCSLNPREDKLAFSAVFIMDENGVVHDRWFGKTIINSDHRFTYENAQETINGDAGNDGPFRNELITLNSIAKKLQAEKFRNGAIEFEQEEIKFKLDENGSPIGVYKKQRLDTHKLVEEYMLLANREVAKFIFDSIKKKGRKDTGAIYRIHDIPDKDRIKDLGLFVRALGYSLNTDKENITAHDLKKLLKQIEGTPHEALIRTATIRSMQKAIYSTKNIGHFGLAFEFYTHFTSPIRRYPDLLVQRILQKHLMHEPFEDRDIDEFQHIAESSTRREIDAADAERTSIKLKQVEYMMRHIGETFEGTISGVTEWGIYVEDIATKCEGMIKIRDLGDDFFEFNKKTYSITGERTHKKFTLGDTVKFKVAGANLDTKTLDYVLG